LCFSFDFDIYLLLSWFVSIAIKCTSICSQCTLLYFHHGAYFFCSVPCWSVFFLLICIYCISYFIWKLSLWIFYTYFEAFHLWGYLNETVVHISAVNTESLVVCALVFALIEGIVFLSWFTFSSFTMNDLFFESKGASEHIKYIITYNIIKNLFLFFRHVNFWWGYFMYCSQCISIHNLSLICQSLVKFFTSRLSLPLILYFHFHWNSFSESLEIHFIRFISTSFIGVRQF